MEEYKGYYIEERLGAPGLMPQEVVLYENEEKMTHGDCSQVFDSVDSAKNWIDAQPQPKKGISDVFKRGTTLLVVDKNGVQLFSLSLGGLSDRSQAWEEVYKTIMEGLPEEAYKPVE